ncbi:MAG: VWA domain-containing protein [Planctomycetales bacterium]|nr:VWA domain-containing protein [Planctomycetales bacterium]
MIWHSPQYLWLVWLIPLVVGVWFLGQLRQNRALDRFASGTMRRRIAPIAGRRRQLLRAIFLIMAAIALVIALARPRWGRYEQEVVQRGVDIFVLLDVSRSMLAEDVVPNRLERAKSDIEDLLSALRGDRVGLIAFAGTPVLKVPLTSDLGFFRQVLQEIDTQTPLRGGSLIGDAIRKGIESLEMRADRDQVFVLITDGDDQESFPLEAARLAADKQIKIITIGLGDPQSGSKIPILDNRGNLAFVEHDGATVTSQLNEQLLRDIAIATSGAYVPARTRAYDLGKVYSNHLAGLMRGELRAEERELYRERFQWFLVAGLACLGLFASVSPWK